MRKILGLLIILFLVPLSTSAQDFCEGLADYDQDVDGTDAAMFKSNFGRSPFGNPCPPDGPAPVPRTGQTTEYTPGDDGYFEKGVEWPNPRFTDNEDGTVTDNLTGLIWLHNANCFGLNTWYDALSDCNSLENGECGLTDGSQSGDWRLPNRFELESLLDLQNIFPALPSGHPFYNVLYLNYYWSSTTHRNNNSFAWSMDMFDGLIGNLSKNVDALVWPVRGGR